VCYPNSTCNTSLSCVNNVCQVSSGAGGGGAGGSGAGGGGGISAGGVSGAGAAGVAGGVGGSAAGASGNGAGGVGASSGSAGASGSVSGSAGASGSAGSTGGGNLITNGDFSQAAAHWSVKFGDTATTSYTTNSGALCVVVSTTTTYLGWPADGETGASLSGSYTLSFQASVSAGMTFADKIGSTQPPDYTQDFQHPQTVGTSLTTITDTNTINDANAGLVFIVSGAGTVCIDNVSLTHN
jgi:hypothetical protein